MYGEYQLNIYGNERVEVHRQIFLTDTDVSQEYKHSDFRMEY
jgi:hypothetical protein